MAQTVLALSAGQALQINNGTAALSINKTVVTDFQHDFESIFIDNTYYKPISIFRYGNRIKVSFGLSHPYAAHYVLTKGLLEFHRSKDFVFDYNREECSFHVSVELAQLNHLRLFLENISVWLSEEIYFKSALKHIISFEDQYKERMKEVYALQRVSSSAGGLQK